MPFFVVFLFCLFSSLSFGVVIDNALPPKGWRELSRSDPNKSIRINIYLKRENIKQLEKKLFDVSDPLSDNYGNFLSIPQILTMIQPKPETILNVKQWLVSNQFNLNNIESKSLTSDVLSIKTNIASIERLLNCTYFDYQYILNKNINNKKIIIISRVKQYTSYDIPSELTKYIDLITPTIHFPAMQYGPKQQYIKKDPSIGPVTPTFLKQLYQTTGIIAKAINNSVGVSSYEGEYYNAQDLQKQWSTYNITSTQVINVPSNQPSGYGLECELDTQYMSSMGEKIVMQAWYTAGTDTLVGFENSLLEWSTNVLNSTSPPLLFSTSYGQYEKNFGSAFVEKFNQDLMALGTAGITVLYSSGDYGAGGDCTATQPFDPHFPASSPYVTAVGGLEGGTPNQQPLGETAWQQGGGGFSLFLSQQSYQTSAVQYYLQTANNLPAANKYNASNRAYPDISAQAVDYLITIEGRSEGVSGTSCSTPSCGGIFGLLNDLRLQNGMKPLGFLNPFIYQTAAADPTAFNDVTDGYINGCSASKAFYAAPKWDPTSGWGSPNYKVLATHVLQTGKKTIKH